MDEKKVDFFRVFKKLKTAEHRNFEITMFAISILMGIAVLISVVMLGMYWSKGASSQVTEDGEDIVSSGAATVADEDEPAEPTATPESSVISDDDDVSTVDEDLKPGKKAYTTAYVNMREDASLTAAVVTKVPSGSRVKLIKLENDEWFKVEYDGVTGYINAMYLSPKKPAPIATATPAPTDPPKKATPTPRRTVKPTKKPPKETKPPKRTMTPEPDDTEEPTEAPTQKPTAEPTQKPTAEPTQKPAPTNTPQDPTAEPAAE